MQGDTQDRHDEYCIENREGVGVGEDRAHVHMPVRDQALFGFEQQKKIFHPVAIEIFQYADGIDTYHYDQ